MGLRGKWRIEHPPPPLFEAKEPMSILDHDIISERYFFPRRRPLEGARMVDVGDAELACFEVDEGHDLTLVHFHGNGEIVADYLPGFADHIDSLGANSFFAEYRGYGGSTGTPRLAAMLDDVDAIRQQVSRPDEQIVVFGRSVGSIYAIEFAARFPDVAGLVLESGIADVRERILLRATPADLGATPEELRAEFDRLFDHQAKLGRYTGPALVMHTENDHLVDKSHAHRNASWAGRECRKVLFERGDHNSIFHVNQAEYLAELGRFLDECR
jgi:pimeloyl-ACP methyl ester carboxylesterase